LEENDELRAAAVMSSAQGTPSAPGSAIAEWLQSAGQDPR